VERLSGAYCYGHQLAATHKVNPGFMFPLKSGLAFLERPALFMPADDVTRVELGRANGTTTPTLLHKSQLNPRTPEAARFDFSTKSVSVLSAPFRTVP
jgi:hypothetical protein